MSQRDYYETLGVPRTASPDDLKDTVGGVLFQVECSQPMDAMQVLDQIPWVNEVSIHGVLLHVSVDHSEREILLQNVLIKNGFEIFRLEETIPSLEDVFISLINEKRELKESL